MSSTLRDLLRPVVRHPSAVLLVVQLVGVLLYPFAESLAWGRGLFELFGALVLGLAVWSVRDSPTPTWVALILGLSASALSVLDALSPNPTVAVIEPAHAAGWLAEAARIGRVPRGSLVVLNLSGRGDKDVETVASLLVDPETPRRPSREGGGSPSDW